MRELKLTIPGKSSLGYCAQELKGFYLKSLRPDLSEHTKLFGTPFNELYFKLNNNSIFLVSKKDEKWRLDGIGGENYLLNEDEMKTGLIELEKEINFGPAAIRKKVIKIEGVDTTRKICLNGSPECELPAKFYGSTPQHPAIKPSIGFKKMRWG